MTELKRIKTALVSVYDKTGIEPVIRMLDKLSVRLISTGGTKDYISSLNIPVTSVEEITTYPSILGGRVKTLHPKIFGGILFRRENKEDIQETMDYKIPGIDLVIVDLYPFESTVKSGAGEEEIIEKIDIGGISLIRAAAKNYTDVLIISSKEQYPDLMKLLEEKRGESTLEDRKNFAASAFGMSSHYDTAIYNWFSGESPKSFRLSLLNGQELRYGENPHQKGFFFGMFDEMFEKISGREISYNNLLDIDSAVNLIREFKDTSFGILKHNNACGFATRELLADAWTDALAGDPVSVFGGILISNRDIDKKCAEEINKIFFEVIIAPSYQKEAIEILIQKKNRIILRIKDFPITGNHIRTVLNGVLVQQRDLKTETGSDLKTMTQREPTASEKKDMLFASKIVKHSKSNSIVLAKNQQLIGSGVGQTSRVDALKQAIDKARNFNFDLKGAVMASDAFFPFSDSVEIAHHAGISAIIQPGGSIRDKDSVDYCNSNNMAMVFTGIRHFRH